MCRAVWIDQISGDFLVASPKVGALRIYNAAIPVCKDIIKVSRHGIYDIQRMSSEIYLIKLKNGQIMQFNIKTKKELFITEVGHVAQIQKTLIHPKNPNVMASAGFDGSVRKWNLQNMQMESIFEHKQGQ